jgi:hypothetical protein
MIQRWERASRPSDVEQARIDARAREQRVIAAYEIAALTERVLLGPPGGGVGAAAWAQELRARLDRFRIGGSLRAENGGAEVLAVLKRQIQRTEAAAEALLAERA